MEKTGAVDILRTMSERELYLHGDPTGQVPLFLLPLRPWRRVKLPKVKPVETKAQYCAELLKHVLIEPMTAGVESGDCDGEVCCGRPELILPPEEYRRYVAIHGERPPIGPHWHIVISRSHPNARRYQFYV